MSKHYKEEKIGNTIVKHANIDNIIEADKKNNKAKDKDATQHDKLDYIIEMLESR